MSVFRMGDPTRDVVKGIAYQGDTPFEMPMITHLKGQLWLGGVVPTMLLPDRFRYVVSMHPDPDERWVLSPSQRRIQFALRDIDEEQDFADVVPAVLATEYFLKLAEPEDEVLVHCQFGLNRSALVAGIVLRRQGLSGAEAVELMRTTRCEAVLCNERFELIVRAWPDVEKI